MTSTDLTSLLGQDRCLNGSSSSYCNGYGSSYGSSYGDGSGDGGGNFWGGGCGSGGTHSNDGEERYEVSIPDEHDDNEKGTP